jgi:transmembrane secretion effector
MVELKGSPTEVVLVQTATTLPVVLFGIAGGALADLADRRAVLLITQTMMLLAAGALAFLDGIGAVSKVSLLGLTFALGVGTALNAPTVATGLHVPSGRRSTNNQVAMIHWSRQQTSRCKAVDDRTNPPSSLRPAVDRSRYSVCSTDCAPCSRSHVSTFS